MRYRYYAILIGVMVVTWWFVGYPAFVTVAQQVHVNHDQTVNVQVSSYGFDAFMWRTNVYLNNGQKLWIDGNLNFKIGARYEITYRDNTNEILSWSLKSDAP